MDAYKGFADLLGSLICHQLPSRSFIVDGMQLPVCARDTGTYLGIFISLVFILISGRRRSDRPPGIASTVMLCVLMLPMMVDGVCSYAGLYETNNTARLLTGALFGLPIPLFLIPAANFKTGARNENAVLKGFTELVLLVAAVLAVSLLILAGLVPYLVLAGIFMASFLFFIGRLAYTVVSRAFRIKPSNKALLSAGFTFCMLAVLYLVSTQVLQPLKAVFAG